MSKLKKLFTLALVALGIAALAPSAAAAYYPQYLIETDNDFDTYYNPFAKPINIQNWLWDLTRHHHWTNSIGYFSTSTGKTCDMSTTGFKKFWQQGNWLLGTDTFCTSNYPSPGTLVLKTIKPKFEEAPYVEVTCLDNIKNEAVEKMPEEKKLPEDFSEDEVQALLTVGVCELFRQHESKYDPITDKTRTTNAAFMSNLVDQVVQVPSINTNRYSTYHMSSWQCGQRLDMNSFRPGEKYLDFNRSEYAVTQLVDFASNHYVAGIDECLRYLNKIPDNWEGSCLLRNRTNEVAMADNTAWRWFDEDVYLDRADVKMLQFFCYMSKVLLLVPKMYEVTGDDKEEKDQLYDIQEYFFSDSKGPIHYDPEMIHNDRSVGRNVFGTWFWPKAAIPRQYYFDKNPENRPYDTFLYGSRVEKCFWAILQKAPSMFKTIDDEKAAADAKDAFTKALACYLDADAFITSTWPSVTGATWGGERNDKQQHLIELDYDTDSQGEPQPGDASVAGKGNAAGWRQLIQTLYKSMTAEGGTTAQDLDLNALGEKFEMRHKGELVDFSGLGANKDGVVKIDACSVFTGALCRTMLKDVSALGLYTNETMTLQGYIVGLYTNRVDGGKMYSRTNWYPVPFNNVNTRFLVTDKTVDKTLGGMVPNGTAIDDLRTMANRYSMTARGATEFAQHFYDERTVLAAGQSTNLVENKTYTAVPTDKDGGMFVVSEGATLTGTNVSFEANETTRGSGAINNRRGTVALKDATFTRNKAAIGGGAIGNSTGSLLLDGITFEGNTAKNGGAIWNGGTAHFDGPVMLVTTNDTICNYGTLNWNLAGGKQGFLDGYQNITNVGANAKLRLTVEERSALPANIVIATGDFSNIDDKNTFSITNATLGGGMATAKINGGFTGFAGSLLGYKLFTEEDPESGTTNLVLHVEEHYTCVREEVTGTKTLESGKTYTAAPATSSFGGVFNVNSGATLTGTDVSFADNEAKKGGAIVNSGTVALTNAVFTGNTAAMGGAIYNNGTLSLGGVTFDGNKANRGGAIWNQKTAHFDGAVTLKTSPDTIYNFGMLNWNLADGKQGLLNGYQNLINDSDITAGRIPVLQLTVEDYAAMPTNFVIATGDFTDVEGKDTFSITNVLGGAALTATINGSLVGNEEGTVGYKLVTVPAGETTNLVFNVYELTDRIVVEAGEVATNLVSGTVYTALPTNVNGGAVYVNAGGKLNASNVIFAGNETTVNGGAIGTVGGTLSLDGVIFEGNEAAQFGGAIGTVGGTTHFDGLVTLKTETDTIWNYGGTMNWNLADGKAGQLNGYEKLSNSGTLQLTIDDAIVAPTNFVIATGDFTDVMGKDTFTIMNVTSGATATIKIGGLALMGGDWWKLAIEGTNLVFSALETAKLSKVEIIDAETGVTNATADVTVGGIAVDQNEDGSYTVPQGEELTLVYTTTDPEKFMFGPGWTQKTVTLEGLTEDYKMTDDDKPQDGEPRWVEVREIAIDTRERIVVADPSEVLPIAYATNFWGTVEEAKNDEWVNVFVAKLPGAPETLVDRTNENGYVEWMPADYGAYDLSMETAHYSTNVTVYYSQPYALTIDQPAEGGKIAAFTNGVEATGTFDLLGYSYVNLAATPESHYQFTGWTATTNGVAYADGFTNATTLVTRFEMPNSEATLGASFAWQSEFNETVVVNEGETWEVFEGDDYKQGITNNGTIVWKPGTTNALGKASFMDDFGRLQNGEGGKMQIVFDESLTNGTYWIASDAQDALGAAFEITNGTSTNDCTVVLEGALESAPWTYVGAKRFKIYVTDGGGYNLKLLVEDGRFDVSITAGEGGTAAFVSGVAGGQAIVGTTVTVSAAPENLWQFKEWTGNAAFESATAAMTTFTMPAHAVSVAATFEVSAAYRKACEDQVNSNRVAAVETLNALALTESEKAAYLADIEEAARKAILAVRNLGTPALVKAAADGAKTELDKTLAEAKEDAEGRVAAWDVGSEVGPAVKAELTTEGDLIISGIGPMKDFGTEGAPWCAEAYATNFVDVIVSSNVTYIGSYAFKDCTELETVDLTEFVEFPVPFFGTGVFEGTEGVKLEVATVEAYKLLKADESYQALDPRPMIVAPAAPFVFEKTDYVTTEGEELDVVVFGGKCDRSTAVTLNFVKGTYTSKPTAYVDGKKATFPITLNWARGEVGEKVVTLVTKKTSSVEEDRTFTLQLGSPAANETGDAQVAIVTVEDAMLPVEPEMAYVRALAWPANGGTVSGSGALKSEKTKLTLKATAKKYATFAGWYLAKTNDVNQIDLENGPVSIDKNLKVGYGTEYGEGTYYAYFTDVLPVASVLDPDETSEFAEGVVYEDETYCLKVGMYAQLPVGLDDESGKGSLTVSSLPSGLKYDKKTGMVYGTPTKACTKEVKVVAKNAAGKQTVYYTFHVEALPGNAVGTWNGVVRKLDDPEDGTHAGFGTVQFSATSAGKLSAKVTTRLTGTKSFSATGYELVDENVYGVEMETKAGEVFSAKLYLTNDWKTAQLVGTVTGGKFAQNGEEVKFAAIRNAFDKKDKNQDALDFLAEFKGTYEDTLYLRDGGEEAGTVTFKVQDGGKVQVKAKSANGSYSATCAGAFRATPKDLGAVQAAVRSGKKLWAADALLDEESGDVEGLACDYDSAGEDTHETIGVPANK